MTFLNEAQQKPGMNFIFTSGHADPLPNVDMDRRFFVVEAPAVESAIDRLMSTTFCPGRDPRSDEYKAGARAVLMFLLEGAPMPRPFEMGTAQADAFYAGVDEGRGVWSRAVSKVA